MGGIHIGHLNFDPGKAIHDAENAISHGVNDGLHTVRDGVNKGLHQIEAAAINSKDQVFAEMRKRQAELVSNVERVGKDVENDIENAVHKAIKAAETAIEKGALKKAVAILRVAEPSSASIGIGPITMTIGDIPTRIDTLAGWVDNPPDPSDWHTIVTTLAPTDVSVTIQAEISAVVVSSESLAISLTLDYTTEDFLNHVDKIKDAF